MRLTKAEMREAESLVFSLLAAEAHGDKGGRDVLLLTAGQRAALAALDIAIAGVVGLLGQAGATTEQIAQRFADRLLELERE